MASFVLRNLILDLKYTMFREQSTVRNAPIGGFLDPLPLRKDP